MCPLTAGKVAKALIAGLEPDGSTYNMRHICQIEWHHKKICIGTQSSHAMRGPSSRLINRPPVLLAMCVFCTV